MPTLDSNKVGDRALRKVAQICGKMLAKAPKELMPSIVRRGIHCSILAFEEGQADLPEYRHMKNDPKTDWDKRARGLGGRTTSGGEENILEYSEDRYRGESIYIHEFAHTLASEGFTRIDKAFPEELKASYEGATKDDLWTKAYAATNEHEYWAEGLLVTGVLARPTASTTRSATARA